MSVGVGEEKKIGLSIEHGLGWLGAEVSSFFQVGVGSVGTASLVLSLYLRDLFKPRLTVFTLCYATFLHHETKSQTS